MNPVALALKVIGIIVIVGGVVLGIASGIQTVGYEDSVIPGELGDPITEFSMVLFLVYTFSGLISGTLLMGFSELINLTDKNKKTTEETLKFLKYGDDPAKEKESADI